MCTKDTDGDGDPDDLDVDPLTPPCLEGAEMLLAAWWDGSTELIDSVPLASDLWAVDGEMSAGNLSSADIVSAQGDDNVFRFGVCAP